MSINRYECGNIFGVDKRGHNNLIDLDDIGSDNFFDLS